MHDRSHDIHYLIVQDDLIFGELILCLLALFLFLLSVVGKHPQHVHQVAKETHHAKDHRACNQPKGDQIPHVLPVRLHEDGSKLLEKGEGQEYCLVSNKHEKVKHVLHPEHRSGKLVAHSDDTRTLKDAKVKWESEEIEWSRMYD